MSLYILCINCFYTSLHYLLILVYEAYNYLLLWSELRKYWEKHLVPFSVILFAIFCSRRKQKLSTLSTLIIHFYKMPSVSLPSGISSNMTFLNLSLFSTLWITLFLYIPRHNFCLSVFYTLYALSRNLSYNSESFISFKNPRQGKHWHTPQWEMNQGILAVAKIKDCHLPWWENPVRNVLLEHWDELHWSAQYIWKTQKM